LSFGESKVDRLSSPMGDEPVGETWTRATSQETSGVDSGHPTSLGLHFEVVRGKDQRGLS